MYCPHEDTAEDNPQICGRAVGGSHNRSENRSESGNVEKLDDENLPCGHRLEVDIVRLCDGRGFAVWVRTEKTVREFSVDEISGYQGQDGNTKRDHSDMAVNETFCPVWPGFLQSYGFFFSVVPLSSFLKNSYL